MKAQNIKHLSDMIDNLAQVKPATDKQETLAKEIAFQIEALAALIAKGK